MDRSVLRQIKPVDITPVLAILPSLQFIGVNVGGSVADPNRYPCFVVLQASFPQALRDFVADLGLGGRLARAILRKLPARQSIPPHIDKWMPAEMDWRRFQVPIVSHPEIVMRWPDDGVAVHLEPGWLYEVRFDRKHEVVNDVPGVERVHLQIDQIGATV